VRGHVAEVDNAEELFGVVGHRVVVDHGGHRVVVWGQPRHADLGARKVHLGAVVAVRALEGPADQRLDHADYIWLGRGHVYELWPLVHLRPLDVRVARLATSAQPTSVAHMPWAHHVASDVIFLALTRQNALGLRHILRARAPPTEVARVHPRGAVASVDASWWNDLRRELLDEAGERHQWDHASIDEEAVGLEEGDLRRDDARTIGAGLVGLRAVAAWRQRQIDRRDDPLPHIAMVDRNRGRHRGRGAGRPSCTPPRNRHRWRSARRRPWLQVGESSLQHPVCQRGPS
jgi:hypothetical protein